MPQVQCRCGKTTDITTDYFKRLTRQGKEYNCISCGVKSSWNEERKLRASLISKNLWGNDEFREKVITNTKIALAFTDYGSSKLKKFYKGKKKSKR